MSGGKKSLNESPTNQFSYVGHLWHQYVQLMSFGTNNPSWLISHSVLPQGLVFVMKRFLPALNRFADFPPRPFTYQKEMQSLTTRVVFLLYPPFSAYYFKTQDCNSMKDSVSCVSSVDCLRASESITRTIRG